MELGPWESCFERIATTPEDANELFRDAVTELNNRASRMAATGKRTWEPTPDNPALIIITDEHAELPEESHDCADSIARRGRAVAVNLMAATQRPTLAAMGRNTAVRSQMDVRICLRVREPRDADLILGQGSLNSGWHAHKLTSPGEFLISSPEHGTPERNRAYLIDDEKQGPARGPLRPAHGPRSRPRCQMRHGRPRNRPRTLRTARHVVMMTGRRARKRRCGTHSWTPARRGLRGGAGGRVRHGPRVGLLPATGARPGGPRGTGAARLLAGRTARRRPARRTPRW